MVEAGSEGRRLQPMSPCISVCVLEQSGYCVGCLRTRDEIAGWSRMTSEQQWDLLRDLDQRRVARRRCNAISGG
ncbi:MAG: DUF1289 domain-containing protein [Gammaproteobacteria bacterium]|nr:DUF1289 domain-containing protein [Gammaproteobacteria bacterium]